MPLILPVEKDPGFQRPMLLSFDPQSKEQTNEARDERDILMSNGWVLNKQGTGFFKLIPPVQPANKGVLRILTGNGDDLVVWDRNVLEEIREAKRQFDDYIKRGYKAFAMKLRGEKGVRLDQFDQSLEQIILTPSTRPG